MLMLNSVKVLSIIRGVFLITDWIFKSDVWQAIIKINKKKKVSLNLLKVKALKAAFKVDFFVTQKLIKTKEVAPINSQPKNKTIKLPPETKRIILMIKKFKKIIKRSTSGSYLK